MRRYDCTDVRARSVSVGIGYAEIYKVFITSVVSPVRTNLEAFYLQHVVVSSPY